MFQIPIKITVAGASGVGKTAMLTRFELGKFVSTTTTIGLNFISHYFEKNNKKISLSIWDFAGEERFRELFAGYCKGSSGCLAVFDCNRVFETLQDLVDWISLIIEKNGNVPIFLVGTKFDLIPLDALISIKNLANQFVKEHHLNGLHLISSKTGEGIDHLFNSLKSIVG